MMLQRKIDAQAFDVFLCYNRQDKLVVRGIAEQLKLHGVLPWFDEWELRPGLPWQRLLEQQIARIRTAAVFISQNDIAPWQHMEIAVLLSQFTERGCPIIPVLLSDTLTRPELPLFLRVMTWVDFRLSDPDPMQQLLWGITGEQ
jgi:hypothetical protein